MKKSIKALLTIEALSSLFVLARLGFAWLNARDPKALEKEVTDIFNMNINEIASDLKLAKVPTLVFNNDYPTTVMATKHTRCTEGFFSKKVTSTEASYVIEANLENIKKLFMRFALLSFNRREIHKALIRQLLLHECRHTWQAQGTFYIGSTVDIFSSISLNGYGESREETDANEYAISKARNKKEKALFKYLKAEQDCHNKLFGNNSDLVVAGNEMRRTWKPLFGFLF